EMIPQLEFINDSSKQAIVKDSQNPKPTSVSQEKDSETEYLYEKFKKYGVFSLSDIENVKREIVEASPIKEPSEEELITMSVKRTSKKAKATLTDSNNLTKYSMKTSTSKLDWERPKTAGLMTLKK